MSFIHRSGPGPRVSAAFAVALLLLAALAGSVAASESRDALRDPFVGPRDGTPATEIRFSVTFQGRGDRAHPHVSVLIDGIAREMTPSNSQPLAFGVRYRSATSLPVGTHRIAFSGTDGSTSGSLDGGLVRIHRANGGDPGTGPGPTPAPTGGTGGGAKPGGTPGKTSPPATPAPPAPKPTHVPAPAATHVPAATGRPHDGAGPTPGSSTGGAQATPNEGSGAADHTPGDPATGAPPIGGPTDGPGDALVAPSASPPPDGLALGLTGTPGDGSGGSDASGGPGASGGSGGSLEDSVLSALTGRGQGITPATRMLVAAISTTTATTVVMAFFMFGKRRRDGDPPAPDEVLAANAGRLALVPASDLVPNGRSDPGNGARLTDETGIPRWRRPSLIEARKADPRYAEVTHDRLSFNHSAIESSAGEERRRIRYRIVSLLDAPDPLRSVAIGDLDEGDEVQLLERSGGYWLVLCPDGSRGWVHRMTLGDVVTDETGNGGFNAARRSFSPRVGDDGDSPSADEPAARDVRGEATEFREIDRSYGEDGTDFLTAYLDRVHRS